MEIFIDAYKIENGLFTKRLVPSANIQTASFITFLQDKEEDDDFFNSDCWNTEGLPADGQLPMINIVVSSGSNGGGNVDVLPLLGGYINSGVASVGGFVPGGGLGGGGAITSGGIATGMISGLTGSPEFGQPDPEKLEDPCDRFKELEEDTYLPDFYTAIEQYANDDNVNYEVAFAMTKQDGGPYDFAPMAGNPNQPYLPFILEDNIKIDIFIHTHYNGLLSIFGVPDLLHYHDLLSNHSANGTNLVYIEVTNAGTRYAIKVNDIAKFNTVANLNLYDDEKFEAFVENHFPNVNDDNDNDTNELNFLKGLKSADMGLSLFEPNSDYTEWKEITLDPNDENNILERDCN